MTDRAQKVLDATKGYKLRYAYRRDRQKIIAVALREAIQCVLPDEIGGVQLHGNKRCYILQMN